MKMTLDFDGDQIKQTGGVPIPTISLHLDPSEFCALHVLVTHHLGAVRYEDEHAFIADIEEAYRLFERYLIAARDLEL